MEEDTDEEEDELPEEFREFYARTQGLLETLDQGDVAQAAADAQRLLEQAPHFAEDWNYGNAVHKAHLVLGEIALLQGDLSRAIHELEEAGKTPGSPQLDSFGPNMRLAEKLLRAGESDAVLRYFDACSKFWSPRFSAPSLQDWRAQIAQGKIPNFGANLQY